MGRKKRLGPGEAGADGRSACLCCGKRVRVKRGPHDYGMIRGVCLPCRASMRRLVARGKTTWAALERGGLLLRADVGGVKQRAILARLKGCPDLPAPRPVPVAEHDAGMKHAKASVLALLEVLARREKDPKDAADVKRLAEIVEKAR